MSEFKNRIITISGEPASGKSTVIKKMKEDYEKQGFRVHIFSVGHEFRKIAQEKGLTIEQFNEYMIKRGNIDELIDSTVEQRGKEINSKQRPDDIYIFDSRLAFHNIPASFSIRLTVDDNVAGKRVFGDNKRGKEDSYTTLEDAVEKTYKRKIREIERYKRKYGIDLQNQDNYKLVIDTSFSSIEDISKVIEECLELELEGKEYSKTWTSPKKLLPFQYETDTIRSSPESNLTLEEWIEKLKKEGYNPELPIKVIKVKDKYINFNGNHRNIASHLIGNTLVPYIIIAKDAELIPGSKNQTAEKESLSLNKNMLFGHEQFFDEPGKQFSYNHIYPGIYDELTKREQEDIYR